MTTISSTEMVRPVGVIPMYSPGVRTGYGWAIRCEHEELEGEIRHPCLVFEEADRLVPGRQD
ncbi:MAG: hypothetical protein WKF28_01195 [Rubrobacteraceae bacterium]|jgi:hypothetical protein